MDEYGDQRLGDALQRPDSGPNQPEHGMAEEHGQLPGESGKTLSSRPVDGAIGREQGCEERAPDGVVDEQGAALTEFAQRVVAMAQQAVESATRSRQHAEAVVAKAREQAATVIAQAQETASSIMADARASEREMLREAARARDAAEAELAKAQAIAEAAWREANALLDAKREESAKLIRESQARAEAESQSIRDRLIGAAESEAQQIRNEAATFSQEVRQRVLELAEATAGQLRSTALALDRITLASDEEPDGAGGYPNGAVDAALEAARADVGVADEMGNRRQKLTKVLLVVSPLKDFDRLISLEGIVGALDGVLSAEVQYLDRGTANMIVNVTDVPSFATALAAMDGVHSAVVEGPDLLKLTLLDPLLPQSSQMIENHDAESLGFRK